VAALGMFEQGFYDKLSGPEGLLEELDSLLRLPEPKADWDF